jgi:uncharacterized protein
VISCVYECSILHARFYPRAHRFSYRIFLLTLDLDELPVLAQQLRILRFERPGLLSFRQRDYFPVHTPIHNPTAPTSPPDAVAPTPPLAPLKNRVLGYLSDQGIHCPPGTRIRLVTLPRVFGYQFNPVSFYFVSTPDGHPLASIAEVTNTFRETKPYLLGPATLQMFTNLGPTFLHRVLKHFYVSPFSDVDVAFEFRLRPPSERLLLQIDDYEGPRRTLLTTVTNLGPPRPLRDTVLAWLTLKYPFVTLKVIAAIHWQALRLYLKRVPWFAKANRLIDQRDLYHPHHSLTVPPSPNQPASRPAKP